MISSNLKDKSYEQMISEAIAQIPLYSKEWTNYNLSDPGIMILENLSAFSVLQQEEISRVPETVKQKLLQMAGFVKKQGCPAKALLYAEKNEQDFTQLPYNQKLYAQHICYELDGRKVIETGRIKKIYSIINHEMRDFSLLTEKFGILGGVEIWGEHPQSGQELFFEVDKITGKEQELIFHVKIEENFYRNPLEEEGRNPFAELEWQIYTTEGFKPVIAKDCTAGFLFSGGIYLTIPKNIIVNERNRYVIKAVLKTASYDIPPSVRRISGLLTEALQMDTIGTLLHFEGDMEISVNHFLLKYQQMQVYVLEKDGFYHPYCEVSEEIENSSIFQKYRKDRCFYKEVVSATEVRLKFIEYSEYKPCIGQEDGIIISVNSMEMMMNRHLGRAYGYDKQRFELYPLKQLWEKRLVLMLSMEGKYGTQISFVTPNEADEEKFSYRYIEEENVIEIQSCGDYEGADIYLAECVFYEGAAGNVLPGNEFEVEINGKKHFVYNDRSDFLGCNTETIEDVRKRFVADINQPFSIITEEDCENITKCIQGLSIHKVKAFADKSNHTIHVVIKPNSKEALPEVSEVYRTIVSKYLEKRRMLTSKIVVEAPVYVPIDVKGTIYMEKYYENGEQEIRTVLEEMLDYTKDRGNFGGMVFYHEIFQRLEALDCVREIYDLMLIPQNMNAVKKIGLDWKLNDNCLCYPGVISIELNTGHY